MILDHTRAVRIDVEHATVAEESIRRAGLEGKVEIHVGAALERLADIEAHSAEARAAAILHGLGFDAAAQAPKSNVRRVARDQRA